MWKGLLSVFLVLANSFVGFGQVCNVESPGNQELVYDYTSIARSDVDILPQDNNLTNVYYHDGKVRLTKREEFGGVSGWFYFKNQERITNGFIATFDYSMVGTGDGFAFVVYNNDNRQVGGSGVNLGYRNSFSNYMVVRFEACPDGVAPCTKQTVSVASRKPGIGNATAAPEKVHGTVDVPAGLNITSGEKVSVTVIYTEFPTSSVKVKYQLAGQTTTTDILTATLDDDLYTIFGDWKFGTVGITASTSYYGDYFLTSDFDVHSMRLHIQPSNSAILDISLGQTVDWGTSHVFQLTNRDSCLKAIPTANPDSVTISANITYHGRVDDNNFTLPSPLRIDQDYYVLTPKYNEAAQVWEVQFDTPPNVPGKWELFVAYDGVRADGVPLSDALITREPPAPPGFPLWGKALLIVLIVLIVLGLIYAVIRLRRYRRKLRENAEDIDAGKEKHKLDILERDVEFNINPMLGSLEEMKQKLKENEAELARLRDGKEDRYDDNYTIDSLQEQNAQLREEMNKLKIEAQQNEALNANYRNLGPATPVKRKEFDQTRA